MLDLKNLGVVEMSSQEVQEIDGGFLPLIVVYGCWGVMLACSAVALGFKAAMK